MKAIMISIKPKWVVKILNGDKTIEIRKTMPKCDLPIDVYIYCTKENDLGRIKDLPKDRYFVDCVETPIDFLKMDSAYNGKGKVVARFNATAEEIICRPIWGEWECYTKTLGYSEISKASCLKNKEIVHYLKGENGTAIHISDLEIFDKPKELSEFRHSLCDNIKNIKVVKNFFDNYVSQYFDNERCRKCRHYDSDSNECLKSFKPLTKAPQNYCYIETEN